MYMQPHRGVPDRAKSATACITSLQNNIGRFNLAVLTLTTKPPNLIPCQIFQLYSIYVTVHAVMLGKKH